MQRLADLFNKKVAAQSLFFLHNVTHMDAHWFSTGYPNPLFLGTFVD